MRLIFVLLMAVLLGGCFVPVERAVYKGHLQFSFDRMAGKLCPSEDNVCAFSPVVVTDFVNLELMKPGFKGTVYSEYLKASLSKVCGCEIYEVKLRRAFKLDEEGRVVALTDNATLLKTKTFNTPWVVIGTYQEKEGYTVVFVRLVNIATGKVKRFVSGRVYD